MLLWLKIALGLAVVSGQVSALLVAGEASTVRRAFGYYALGALLPVVGAGIAAASRHSILRKPA